MTDASNLSVVGRLLLCAVALGLFVAAPAQAASPKDQLKKAQAAYDEYRYPQAITQLERLLADPNLSDGGIRQKARELLAFSYYLSNRESDGQEQLAKLFRENVDYPLDRDSTHPDLVRFYDGERNRYVAALNTKPAQIETKAPASRRKPSAMSILGFASFPSVSVSSSTTIFWAAAFFSAVS
jgi:hypothetical protein